MPFFLENKKHGEGNVVKEMYGKYKQEIHAIGWCVVFIASLKVIKHVCRKTLVPN
jgi:hypothetical protein